MPSPAMSYRLRQLLRHESMSDSLRLVILRRSRRICFFLNAKQQVLHFAQDDNILPLIDLINT